MQHFVYALVEDMDVRYVGYTARLKQRRGEHLSQHPDWHLLTLGAYDNRQTGLDQERAWIKRLYDAGHPLTNIAEGRQAGHLGRAVSYLTRARLSEAQRGNIVSPKTRAQMSTSQKKRWESPEARSKQAARMIGNKNGVALKGKPKSAETRARMSAATKGKPKSPEHRAKITARNRSSEMRARVSAAKVGKGKPWSPERRAAYDLKWRKV